MELTRRQEKILHLIKENSPISGEDIAQNLGLTRSALRTDFSILRKMSLISARQNYGYCYIGGENKHKVGQVMGEPKKWILKVASMKPLYICLRMILGVCLLQIIRTYWWELFPERIC